MISNISGKRYNVYAIDQENMTILTCSGSIQISDIGDYDIG